MYKDLQKKLLADRPFIFMFQSVAQTAPRANYTRTLLVDARSNRDQRPPKRRLSFEIIYTMTGRKALVTGSSQGIGLALAKDLAEAGATVVLNGCDTGKLEQAAAAIGPETQILAFDVTKHEHVRASVDRFEAESGTIDILVNNAGVQHRAPLENFPAEEFDRLLHANVSSVFNVGQAVARHMMGRGAGKIINIASVQTALARPSIASYTATRGAVGNLTKGMATD